MKRLAITTLALALTAATSSAFAQDGYGYDDNGYADNDSAYYNRDSYGDSRYDQARYDQTPYSISSPRSDVAQVVRVDPIIEQYGSYQRQECWNERTNRYDNGYYRDGYGHLYRGDGRNNTSGALLGALVGGALGNQVGKGDGRTAATIAGAVIGAQVGSHAGSYNNRYDGYDRYRDNTGVIRRCRTVNDYGNNYDNQRVRGYNVTYRYAGRTYHAFTHYHPGSTMRVVVDVRPQDDHLAYAR